MKEGRVREDPKRTGRSAVWDKGGERWSQQKRGTTTNSNNILTTNKITSMFG